MASSGAVDQLNWPGRSDQVTHHAIDWCDSNTTRYKNAGSVIGTKGKSVAWSGDINDVPGAQFLVEMKSLFKGIG